MEEMIFFDNAKESVTKFFEKEFENFPALLMSHFLNKFNDIFEKYNQDGELLKLINNNKQLIKSIKTAK